MNKQNPTQIATKKKYKRQYDFLGDYILKDGHKMFIEDIVKDLNSMDRKLQD